MPRTSDLFLLSSNLHDLEIQDVPGPSDSAPLPGRPQTNTTVMTNLQQNSGPAFDRRGNPLSAIAFPVFAVLAMQVQFQKAQIYSLTTPEGLVLSAGLVCAGAAAGLLLHRSGRVLGAVLVGLLASVFFNHVLDWEALGVRMRVSIPLIFAAGFAFSWLTQRKAPLILGVGAGAILISALLVPGPVLSREKQNETSLVGEKATGPAFIHLILDGHLGIEGFPLMISGAAEAKALVRDFYLKRGFRVYGRAISRHNMTNNSIPETLNLGGVTKDGDLVDLDAAKGFVVRKSSVFQQLGKMGYRIRVYQTDALDYCGLEGVAECVTVRHRALNWLADADIEWSNRLYVLVSAFLNRATLWRKFEGLYHEVRQAALASGIPLPDLKTNPNAYPPLTMIPLFERLTRDVADLDRGNVLFSHLMLPHGPYALDEDCRLRRPAPQWYGVSAKEEYRLYFKQLSCTYRLLDRLFQAIGNNPRLADATIIVHGDHGSRIEIEGLPEANQRVFTNSTLFVARRPGAEPGYVEGIDNSTALFARQLAPLGISAPELPGPRSIMLRTTVQGPLGVARMPNF